MGITALLPQLRSITKRAHIEAYRGQTVAIDGYVLLHRGAYACARELVEGEPTDKYVTYCMGRIELLIRHGVVPYVVMDGGPLPGKAGEEETRNRSREEHRERARNLWSQGNRVAAMESYQKAVDVTPEMAHAVVLELKRRGIRFLVAPYEADAQLAYLALNGLVDAVLTEDSDLLCYGCPVVLFKLERGGELEEIALANLPHSRELNFTGWTHDLFQQMCVMAGCDFVKGLPGIGIKKAHAQIRRTRDILRSVRALRFDGIQAPPGYEIKVQRALWTFRHQKVYCPRQREIVPLTEPPGGSLAAQAAVPAAALLAEGEPDFLGAMLPVHVAQGIAEGRLHPVTYQPLPTTTSANTGGGGGGGASSSWQTSGQSSGSSLHHKQQQQQVTLPIQISAEARQTFKKPRMASTDADAKNQHPLGRKPPQQPRSRLPAALTAQRYFFPSTKKDAPSSTTAAVPASGGGGGNTTTTTLRTTLQAALLACNTNNPPPLSSSPNEDLDEEDEIDRKVEEYLNEDAAETKAEEEGKSQKWLHKRGGEAVQGSRKRLGDDINSTTSLAPLWRPQTGWRTPLGADGRLKENITTAGGGGGGGGAQEPSPLWDTTGIQDITPGFYAALDSGAPATAAAARRTTASAPPPPSFTHLHHGGGSERPPHGNNTTTTALPSSPRQLQFVQRDDDDNDDVKEKKVDQIHFLDLSHLPACAAASVAAVEAAVEHSNVDVLLRAQSPQNCRSPLLPSQQLNNGSTGASIFQKFSCKK